MHACMHSYTHMHTYTDMHAYIHINACSHIDIYGKYVHIHSQTFTYMQSFSHSVI